MRRGPKPPETQREIMYCFLSAMRRETRGGFRRNGGRDAIATHKCLTNKRNRLTMKVFAVSTKVFAFTIITNQ